MFSGKPMWVKKMRVGRTFRLVVAMRRYEQQRSESDTDNDRRTDGQCIQTSTMWAWKWTIILWRNRSCYYRYLELLVMQTVLYLLYMYMFFSVYNNDHVLLATLCHELM